MKCTRSFSGNEIYKTKCHRVHFSVFIHRKWNVVMYKTKLQLFASKEKHVGKKHYLFLHKDFDWSKKLSQFTFNGQNVFFFWLTPCSHRSCLLSASLPTLVTRIVWHFVISHRQWAEVSRYVIKRSSMQGLLCFYPLYVNYSSLLYTSG
jgi:hypothetical protein